MRAAAGLGLIEAVISLAITAMLLGAVAAAFSAASNSIEINDQFFTASQGARVGLNQVLAAIRRAQSLAVTTNQIDMFTYDGKPRSYIYDSGTQILRLVTNDILTDPDYTVARNVTSFAFAADTFTDGGGISHVSRVSINFTVQVGNNQVGLAGSAAPRREVVYK
jgi:hypothetical protein